MSNWDKSKAQILGRLKRAEGQVHAVIGMVEREEDCERIAQQLAAARKALDRSFYDMIGCMTRRELAEIGVDEPAVDQRVAHMTDLLTRYG